MNPNEIRWKRIPGKMRMTDGLEENCEYLVSTLVPGLGIRKGRAGLAPKSIFKVTSSKKYWDVVHISSTQWIAWFRTLHECKEFLYQLSQSPALFSVDWNRPGDEIRQFFLDHPDLFRIFRKLTQGDYDAVQ